MRISNAGKKVSTMKNTIFLYERNGHLHFSTNAPAFHQKSRLLQTANFARVPRPEALPEPKNQPFVEGEVIDGSPFVDDYIRIYDIIPHN